MKKTTQRRFEPACVGGTQFRVPIATTSANKIMAVAYYKKQQFLKRVRAAAEEGKHAEDSAAIAVEGSSDHTGQKLVLQAPSIGVVIPANKMQSVSDESIHRDLLGFDRNFKLLKTEMNSLTNVRMSLLWLLKKTTDLEMQINNSSPPRIVPN